MKHFVSFIQAYIGMGQSTTEQKINKDIEMREQNGWYLKDIKPINEFKVFLIYEK